MSSLESLFERLYTLIGEEYTFVVAVDNESEFSRTAYRPILKSARLVSSGTSRFIKGTVVSFDIPPLNIDKLRTAVEDQPSKSNLVLAIVTEGDSSHLDLTNLNQGCSELEGFKDLVTGGYVIFSKRDGKGNIKLCEQQPKKTSSSSSATRTTSVAQKAKFLIGDGGIINDDITVSYAIRIRTPPAPKKSTTGDSSTTLQQWEKVVQETVERELGKLLEEGGGGGVNQIDLGDGLIARVWPEFLRQISTDTCWHSVFTHHSVDPTPHRNYESKETLGDSVLSLVLTHHLLSSSKEGYSAKSDSDSITDIRKVILADNRQTEMAITMGFNREGLIRSSVGVDSKILEDVLEAFFGCLFTVANKISQNSGLSLCEALFFKILEESSPELNIWSIGKDSPTVLDQLFKRMRWGDPIVNYSGDGVTTINLTREAYSFLQTVGPPFKFGPPLTIGPKTPDMKSSKKAAASIALATLKLIWGIDTKYTHIQVRNRLLADEKYRAAHKEALKVAKKLGFVDIYVARRAKHSNQLYVVMGVRADGSEEQLSVYKYDRSGSATVRKDDTSSTRTLAYITALKRFMLP